jgi:hypothetical protein
MSQEDSPQSPDVSLDWERFVAANQSHPHVVPVSNNNSNLQLHSASPDARTTEDLVEPLPEVVESLPEVVEILSEIVESSSEVVDRRKEEEDKAVDMLVAAVLLDLVDAVVVVEGQEEGHPCECFI